MKRLGFVVFPNVTQLDFTGPIQILSRLPDAETHVVAETLNPVPTDCGFSIVPTATYDACPKLDVICVPGGYGVEGALADGATVPFLARVQRDAAYVTSVCTGAFLLGATGLLEGRRATTHWAYHDLLRHVGATPTERRVVRDGHVITGGGVTAGIDFALTLASELAGPEVARTIQLAIEYDPCPPYESGHPRSAPESTRALVEKRFAKRRVVFEAALKQALEQPRPIQPNR
jgi:cyclohexyl-isocyanide hydratase